MMKTEFPQEITAEGTIITKAFHVSSYKKKFLCIRHDYGMCVHLYACLQMCIYAHICLSRHLCQKHAGVLDL